MINYISINVMLCATRILKYTDKVNIILLSIIEITFINSIVS